MRIAIAGTGKVATCLAINLSKADHQISYVISRSSAKADSLAELTGAIPLTYQRLPDIASVDVLLLAVPDDHISEVADRLSAHLLGDCVLIHHSGVGETLRLKRHSSGVMWPIYSLDRSTDMTTRRVPFAIDGSDKDSIVLVEQLARSVSDHVERYTVDQRRRLHLGATMSNNLVVHLLNAVFTHLSDHDLDPLILAPLVRDSIAHRLSHSDAGLLTGPASRADYTTIDVHKQLLDDDPSLLRLYNVMTQDILQKLEKPKS